MQKKKSTHDIFLIVFRVIFTFCALYTMYFIFSNSLEIADISAQRSGRITSIINAYLVKLDLPTLTNHIVRKLAHFCEYALLGFWYTLCLRVYTNHYIRHISWPLFLVLVMANADETLQTFVSGRSGQVSDVWLDFGGGVAGLFAALCAIWFITWFFRLLGFGRKHRR